MSSANLPLPPPPSNSSPNLPPQTKTILPLYLAQANVFTYDTSNVQPPAWTPVRSYPVPISILYDENRAIYRIISMDLGTRSAVSSSKKVLVNSTLLPFLEFHKTSSTFGHWTDKSTGKIHGIGFHSPFELDAFEDSLKKAQSGILTRVRPSATSSSPALIASVVGCGGDSNSEKNCIHPSGVDYPNWSALLSQVKKTHAKVPMILVEEEQQTQQPQGQTHHGQIGQGEGVDPVYQSLSAENSTLRSLSMESSANANKWQLQIATLQSEQQILSKNIASATTQLEELLKIQTDYKAMLKSSSQAHEMQKIAHSNSSEIEKQGRNGRKTMQDLVELENHYKSLLDETRLNLECVVGANKEGVLIFKKIEYLLGKTCGEIMEIRQRIMNK